MGVVYGRKDTCFFCSGGFNFVSLLFQWVSLWGVGVGECHADVWPGIRRKGESRRDSSGVPLWGFLGGFLGVPLGDATLGCHSGCRSGVEPGKGYWWPDICMVRWRGFKEMICILPCTWRDFKEMICILSFTWRGFKEALCVRCLRWRGFKGRISL